MIDKHPETNKFFPNANSNGFRLNWFATVIIDIDEKEVIVPDAQPIMWLCIKKIASYTDTYGLRIASIGADEITGWIPKIEINQTKIGRNNTNFQISELLPNKNSTIGKIKVDFAASVAITIEIQMITNSSPAAFSKL